MHDRSRPSLAQDGGFTLVELLVVILILGILATIALPGFLTQRAKGQDSVAQATARSLQTAAATYQTDTDSYDATPTDLVGIEPTLADVAPAFTYSGTVDTYELTVTSKSTTTFTLRLEADGTVTRSCSAPGRGRCRTDSSW